MVRDVFRLARGNAPASFTDEIDAIATYVLMPKLAPIGRCSHLAGAAEPDGRLRPGANVKVIMATNGLTPWIPHCSDRVA